jgi:hypothetical protein
MVGRREAAASAAKKAEVASKEERRQGRMADAVRGEDCGGGLLGDGQGCPFSPACGPVGGGPHPVEECGAFLALPWQHRLIIAKGQGWCCGCLYTGSCQRLNCETNTHWALQRQMESGQEVQGPDLMEEANPLSGYDIYQP